LRHLVRCESRVCSEADLSLGFELLVEPDSEFLDFVAQILTLFAGDPGLLFQDSRDRVLPLLQATLHLPKLFFPELVLLFAHFELTVGTLQIIALGLVLLEANIFTGLVQPVLTLIALVNELLDFVFGLIYLILLFVKPGSEFVN